ncbi:polyprenyl synthetase family protein [soil metagenome]
MPAFSPSIDELRAAVDAGLADFLDRRREELPEAGLLISEMKRLLAAGGKRLRPAFCYWGYRAAGGEDGGAIIRVAGALELLHTFALVHDDIMDAADVRRGAPTVHALYGADVALLVGDLALVLADAAFFGGGFPPQPTVASFAHYSRMRQEVIAGQFLDVQAAGRAEVTEEEARRIAVLKSGRYTVEEPLLIGASLAGAEATLLGGLAAFGRPLGEGFPLRDDLLGLFGERTSTGKSVDSDIREGKRNLLFARTLAALSGAERDFFVGHWGGGESLDEGEVARLRALVASSGAQATVEQLLGELAALSGAALDQCPTPADARAALLTLARLAVQRDL